MANVTNASEIPWKRITVEAVAIVGSILLAFAIDTWWNDRQDRAEELRTLRALSAEFELNAQWLAYSARSHAQTSASADALLEALRQSDQDNPAVVSDSDVYLVSGHLSFNPISGAYDAMLQSGTFRFIRNPEIRESLAAWPATVSDATENDHLLRTILGPKLNDVLMQQVNFLTLDAVEDCYNPETQEICSKTEVSLRPTLELIGRLVDVKGWTAGAAREFEYTEKVAREIIQQLEQEVVER